LFCVKRRTERAKAGAGWPTREGKNLRYMKPASAPPVTATSHALM
jgi:hypothetical protein